MAALLLVIMTPLLEIAGFVVVGDALGLLPTLALVLLSGLLGAGLLRAQPVQVVAELRAAADRGEPPARALFDAVCRAVAGVLLIVPGFFTDALALLLLLPGVRTLLFGRVHAGIVGGRRGVRVVMGGRPMGPGGGPARPGGPHADPPGAAPRTGPRIVDADWTEVEGEPRGRADTTGGGPEPGAGEGPDGSRWGRPGPASRP